MPRKSRAEIALIAAMLDRSLADQTFDESVHALRKQFGDRAVDLALQFREQQKAPNTSGVRLSR
jgi:hypothetical protein